MLENNSKAGKELKNSRTMKKMENSSKTGVLQLYCCSTAFFTVLQLYYCFPALLLFSSFTNVLQL
jgi:hypothetical protein